MLSVVAEGIAGSLKSSYVFVRIACGLEAVIELDA